MLADSIVQPALLTSPFATMRLSAWQYIFYVTLVFACGCANAGSIAKRDDNDSNPLSEYVDTLIDYVGQLPVIGGRLAGMLELCVQAISLFEEATNGALEKFLAGALPCTVSLNGTTCSGLSNDGGFEELLMNVIDGIPSLIHRRFTKCLIGLGIEWFM